MVCDRKRNAGQMQGDVAIMSPGLYHSDCVLDLSYRMTDDKPFACKVPGCNQKFVNEDHLEVHRKKHDINLGFINLKSLDTPVIADQTPTPTRFLKHLAGDDVLFNELPPNPFDVEFRKAASDKGVHLDSAVDSVSDVQSSHCDTISNGGDSLNPSLDAMATVSTSDVSLGESQASQDAILLEEIKPKENEEVIIETRTRTVADITDSDSDTQEEVLQKPGGPTTVVVVTQPPQSTVSSVNQTVQLQNLGDQLAMSGIPLTGPLVIKLSSGQTIPFVPPSVTNPNEPIPVAISANPMKEESVRVITQGKPAPNNAVKMKLKTTLLSNQSQGNMNVMAQAVDVVTRQQEVKVVSPASLDSQTSSGIKRQRSTEDDPETKRQKFLERNRAAAMRCRTKRKQWITNLEKRAEELTTTNVGLNNEVTKLRNEVAQLKELLLAHKDCPVTLQQRAAGMFMRDMPKIHKISTDDTSTVITVSTSNPS
ncbi:cyclic AMP-dependent transcription factor ATF-7-like isoform X2 [Diadema antillarum]|uniref:cyclic AMP-dependent transcription factor ATF-7-like isoform X2 n=1 Tax=Diadema antillarum TaxID=105358 RepID=UPI003A86AEBD